jgi:hypothetical protein
VLSQAHLQPTDSTASPIPFQGRKIHRQALSSRIASFAFIIFTLPLEFDISIELSVPFDEIAVVDAYHGLRIELPTTVARLVVGRFGQWR